LLKGVKKLAGLLEKIRAIEFADMGVGPIAGVILAELGAEVIKIERPVPVRPANRISQNVEAKVPNTPPPNMSFEFSNRHKKSITIDLTKKKGKEIVYKLIEKSDVFFSNYLPGSLQRVGFDYNTLSKYNPKLVYVTSSAYGQNGPDSEKKAFDQLIIARSGLMMGCGEPDSPPVSIRGAVADTLASTFIAFAVVGGLLAREQLGTGQFIESSLLAPTLWAQYVNISQYLMSGRAPERLSNIDALTQLGSCFKCKDGRWLFVAIRQSAGPDVWPEFCQILGIESLENDPRFIDKINRQKNSIELVNILNNRFFTRSRDEWVQQFKAKNATFAYEVIHDITELPDDPQVLANNYIVNENHPVLGQIKRLRFPLNFNEAPIPVLKPAPQLGEHTEDVLKELGYTSEELAILKNDKVI
jgi:crotonobetainyl-CoA:carnitine CoA-transferase CaiB-like acyl-CoA transferase